MINLYKLQETWDKRINATGYKKKAFAINAGITPVHLSRLLHKVGSPSIESIHAIEDELARLGQPFKSEYVEDGR